MFCHKCGLELPENSKFCPQCGSLAAPIKETSTANKLPGTASEKPKYIPGSPRKILGGVSVVTDDMLKDSKFKAIIKFGVSNFVATVVAIILIFTIYLNGMMDEIYYDTIVDSWDSHFVFMVIAILLAVISFCTAYLISRKELEREIGDSVIIAKVILCRVFIFWEKPAKTGNFAEDYANEFMNTQMQNFFRVSIYCIAISIFLCILPHFIM